MDRLLNNREISILIWLVLIICWAVSIRSVRKGFRGILKAALHWKIVSCVLSLLVYVSIIAFSLDGWQLWGFENLKATILWTCTAGFGMVIANETGEPTRRHFKAVILGGIKFTIVLEFLVNFYVFPIIAELVLIPILAFLTACATYAEIKEEYKQTAYLFNGMLSLLGFGVLIYASYHAWNNWESFARIATVLDFLLPLLLTFLIILTCPHILYHSLC